MLGSARSQQQSKAERVAFSSELLEILTSQGRNKFDHVITGDEFWFHFECPHAAVWVLSRNEISEKNQKISTKKYLVSII
jgi:hypothetical protein